jgi:hypothetical protein
VLLAERWLDARGRPALSVPAYAVAPNGQITAVEPGTEKNKRLGARFVPASLTGATTLHPGVIKDLSEIRDSCPAPVS